MKLIIDDDKIIVFLNNKKYISYNENEIEEYFKSLLSKIEERFNIDISDYSEICVYKDYNYGMILEITNDDLDYFFDSTEIKVFKNNNFLYEINYNYIDKEILKNNTLYKLNNKFYLKIESEIDEIIFSKILEYSDIIYGEKIDKIEKISKKVNYETTSCSTSW